VLFALFQALGALAHPIGGRIRVAPFLTPGDIVVLRNASVTVEALQQQINAIREDVTRSWTLQQVFRLCDIDEAFDATLASIARLLMFDAPPPALNDAPPEQPAQKGRGKGPHWDLGWTASACRKLWRKPSGMAEGGGGPIHEGCRKGSLERPMF
jgi:hypothetical protein